MHYQLERAAIVKSNSGEVTHVARCQPADAERFNERHDRAVHETEVEIGEQSVHFHGPRKLTNGRRRVGEGAAGDVVHKHLHGPALIAKEVVDFGMHETGNLTGACLIALRNSWWSGALSTR